LLLTVLHNCVSSDFVVLCLHWLNTATETPLCRVGHWLCIQNGRPERQPNCTVIPF